MLIERNDVTQRLIIVASSCSSSSVVGAVHHGGLMPGTDPGDAACHTVQRRHPSLSAVGTRSSPRPANTIYKPF